MSNLDCQGCLWDKPHPTTGNHGDCVHPHGEKIGNPKHGEPCQGFQEIGKPITDADIVIMETDLGRVEINRLRKDLLAKLEPVIRCLQHALWIDTGCHADISIKLKGGS